VNVHTSHDIAITLEGEQTGPVFIPLLDLPAGTLVLESQTFLAWSGTPPEEVRLMLCPAGTPLGAPVTPLAEGRTVRGHGPNPPALEPGLPDLRHLAGTLGMTVLTGTLPAGTALSGRLALVHAAV
jgi:hypothetical protein